MILVFSKVEWHRRHREVAILDKRDNGQEFVASPLVFTDCTNMLLETPTVGPKIGVEFLQAALDHAWEIGLRPRGFSDVPLQVEAIKKHLEDMRALAFLGKLPALVPPGLPEFEVPAGLDSRK